MFPAGLPADLCVGTRPAVGRTEDYAGQTDHARQTIGGYVRSQRCLATGIAAILQALAERLTAVGWRPRGDEGGRLQQ